MWITFGALSIITAILNLLTAYGKKDPKWFRFASLSFTALTMCEFYSAEAQRALAEDWAGISDIMPTMSYELWFCVIASIIVNGITLFTYKDKK